MLILARIAGLMIEAPLFSARTIPASAKTALAIWVTSVLWFVLPIAQKLPDGGLPFVFLIINEVTIGFLIGFICHIFFAAVQSSGDFIDLQMGLSIASAFDPSTGGMVSIIGRLSFYLALVVFVIINGHHMLFAAVANSFSVLPIGTPINITGGLVIQLISTGTAMLLIAVQLATPVIILVFLSDFSFGIISRVAPQVNVFQLGFQVKPTLGLIVILLSIPLLIKHITGITSMMVQEVIKLLANIR